MLLLDLYESSANNASGETLKHENGSDDGTLHIKTGNDNLDTKSHPVTKV